MDKVVGVLGGGQLGRMLLEAANRLNIQVIVLDAPNSPAKQVSALHCHINGSFAKPDDVRKLAQECDILTVEIEHVDTEVLQDISEGTKMGEDGRLVKVRKVPVQPSWRTIRVIQDKYAQKEHLIAHGVATARSNPIEESTQSALEQAGDEFGYPFMLKSRTQAYDGRGNFPIRASQDVSKALETLRDRPLYAEKWANFKMELAVMVIKTAAEASVDRWKESTLAFPVVETVHEDSICKLVYAPAREISHEIRSKAQEMARRAVSSFVGKGVFGVEMFLLEDDTLLVNEIAPRPHNSGHYTIEACQMSQYEAHLRAILDIDIPKDSAELNTPNTHAVMLNILGGAQPDSHMLVVKDALKVAGARVHLYGKGAARPGRKMGHITVTAASMEKVEKRMKPLIACVDGIRKDRERPQPESKVEPTSAKPPTKEAEPSRNPMVLVTMGSDSDLAILNPGMDILDDLEIPYEVTITSAHRTPDLMDQYAQGAASRGIKVIIAAAGGAAHLPGMIAAKTSLPVIGVPVKASTLDGMDSLLSIVQMPRGVPVAAVAINNSTNAALLAVRNIGAFDSSVRSRVEKYAADMAKGVREKAERLEKVGRKNYFSEKGGPDDSSLRVFTGLKTGVLP